MSRGLGDVYKRQSQDRNARLESEVESRDEKISLMDSQLENLKTTNTNLLDRLSDLSIVSRAGAENIKKSLEALDRQNKYVQDLNRSIRQKDSINLNLVMNLKRSLADINDEDIQVEVKKGVVYVSISDKLLFRSGSAKLSKDAEAVMAKVAAVL